MEIRSTNYFDKEEYADKLKGIFLDHVEFIEHLVDRRGKPRRKISLGDGGECLLTQLHKRPGDYVIEESVAIQDVDMPYHSHETNEWMLVVRGVLHIKKEGEKDYILCKHGEGAFIPKNTKHTVKTAKGTVLVVVMIPDDGEFDI